MIGTIVCLIAINVQNWNADLSPWCAPVVFGREGFGSGAADTLVEVLKHVEDRNKTYYIGGCSQAGLFALWAACGISSYAVRADRQPSQY